MEVSIETSEIVAARGRGGEEMTSPTQRRKKEKKITKAGETRKKSETAETR